MAALSLASLLSDGNRTNKRKHANVPERTPAPINEIYKLIAHSNYYQLVAFISARSMYPSVFHIEWCLHKSLSFRLYSLSYKYKANDIKSTDINTR